MKYRAVKKGGYGECVSDNISYVADHVNEWCGPYFDLYIDGKLIPNPIEYLAPHRTRRPITLEEKIADMCYQIDDLKERINKAVDMLDLIVPELWNINNHMTYKVKDVRRVLKGE